MGWKWPGTCFQRQAPNRPHAIYESYMRPEMPGYISVCSEIFNASPTSMSGYLTVLSSLVCPSSN